MQTPDLSADSLRDFWCRFDPALAALLSVMDRSEAWTVDREPAIAQRLVALGQRMTGPRQAAALASADREDLLLFLAYISTSRAMRIIHWMDEAGGHGSALVERLLEPQSPVASAVPLAPLRELLTLRLRVISNTPYFVRLFAPDRLQGLGRAIHRYREEVAHDAA